MSQQGFAAKIDPTGTTLVYSTLLGGALASAVAVDAAGNAYLTGNGSSNLPLRNPIRPFPADTDAFVMKIDPAGSTFVYSTYLGGSRSDSAFGIAVDGAGQAFVTGWTVSPDFPLVRPLPSGSSPGGGYDAFLTKLGPGGDLIVYSTYLGGGGQDDGRAVAVDAAGSAYVAGASGSPEFPMVGALQPAHQSGWDAYLVRVSDDAPAPVADPPPGGGRLEQDHPAVHYAGTWFSSAASGDSAGTAQTAVDSASRMVLTFQGTGVKWIGYRDEWSGIARVILDGVVAGTVDTYVSPAEFQSVIWSMQGLADGPHTVVLEATGTANPLSGGAWIWVDAFDVTGGASSGGHGPAPPSPGKRSVSREF